MSHTGQQKCTYPLPDHRLLIKEFGREYFEGIIGVTRNTGKAPEEIKLKFSVSSAPYVATKPLHLSQKITWLEKGELEVRITVIPNYELESVILSFGENVRVIEPTWLSERINERLKEAVCL